MFMTSISCSSVDNPNNKITDSKQSKNKGFRRSSLMNNADETENSIRQLIDHQAWECLHFYLFLEVNNLFLSKSIVAFMSPQVSLGNIGVRQRRQIQFRHTGSINMSETFNSWMVFSKLSCSDSEFCSFWLIIEYASAILSCSAAFMSILLSRYRYDTQATS